MIEKLVYDQLHTDSATVAIVGDRIYPALFPQGVVLPRVLIRRVGSSRGYSTEGENGLQSASVLTQCQASDYESVKSLAAAVATALSGFRGEILGKTVAGIFLENEVDTEDYPQFGNEVAIHSVDQVWLCWWNN
jgi:hypothetical protein